MGEGNFGGDGSVKWQVVNTNDKGAAFGHQPPAVPGGRRTVTGIDDQFGNAFSVTIRRPQGAPGVTLTPAQFAALFTAAAAQAQGGANSVVIQLPNDGRGNTVIVGW